MVKRVLAILLAALMLLMLFAGCANDTGGGDTDDGSSADSGTNADDGTNGTDTGDEDAPEEVEALRLTFMQQEGNIVTYTEAIQADYATMNYLDEQALEQNNLIVERTAILADAYATTLNAYLAGNTLLDGFYSSSNYLPDDSFIQQVEAGRFAELDEVLTHSTGVAKDLLSPGGSVTYIRALGLMEDGKWYRMGQPDGNGSYLDLDSDGVDYINNWPLHTWYNLAIRKDWLDKCGLSMPQTTEEFKNALIAFQDNDVNGNGSRDERAYLGIGMANGEVIFSNGVAQWFGLPVSNFAMDPATGQVENAVEGEGYVPFVSYMKELYEAGVAYTNEGNAWSYSVNVAANTASAHVQYPERMMQSSCETATGDPDAQYDQMPIIQAVEGIKPVIIGQSSTASNGGISFRAEANYDAIAAYLDFIYGETFYMTLMYGLEGYGYEYDADGNFVILTMTDQEEDYSYGDCWHYLAYNFWPQIQIGWVWDPLQNVYSDFNEALENGEPYTWKFMTKEEFNEANAMYNYDDASPLEQYYRMIDSIGLENLTVKLNTTYAAPATVEESEISALYYTDLNTYLMEMTTGYITGTKSIETYEEDIQYAYDTLGLAEYVGAMQARVNRYLEAIGHATYEG